MSDHYGPCHGHDSAPRMAPYNGGALSAVRMQCKDSLNGLAEEQKKKHGPDRAAHTGTPQGCPRIGWAGPCPPVSLECSPSPGQELVTERAATDRAFSNFGHKRVHDRHGAVGVACRIFGVEPGSSIKQSLGADRLSTGSLQVPSTLVRQARPQGHTMLPHSTTPPHFETNGLSDFETNGLSEGQRGPSVAMHRSVGSHTCRNPRALLPCHSDTCHAMFYYTQSQGM